MNQTTVNTSPETPSQLARFLAQHALDSYEALIQRADADPEWFWRAVMEFHRLHFYRPFRQLLDVSDGIEWARWCVGGTTNLAYNCLDRTIDAGRGAHPAIEWVGENGEERALCHEELRSLVRRAAAGLEALGCGEGDVVGMYLPMIPETVAVYLAIVSIGAIALPMFSGFGALAIADRLRDAGAHVVVTADCTWRRGKCLEMLPVIEEASGEVPTLKDVVVVRRHPGEGQAAWPVSGALRFTDWEALIARGAQRLPTELPAEAPAMIVYTSGTTGRPKGTVHTHCGFMTKVALDFGIVMDLQPSDRLLWMSDMGWLTGPVLAVAVPLVGATLVLAEGVPDYPQPGRLWQLVQERRVSFLGVAPTMIRAFMQQQPQTVSHYNLSSLRLTAATGEPWTPEAWTWLREHAGRVPLLNYSGGTEIGGGILAGTMLDPDLPPCAFSGPIPGMGAAVLNEAGQLIGTGQVGELVLKKPSIGLTRGFWNDRERYLESYWSKMPGVWVHGDFASIDAQGYWYIHGRSDDTIKIAGKRTGPAEIEAALLGTGKIAEAAAVGLPDAIKGAAVVCICVPARGVTPDAALVEQLREAVAAALGSSFRPKAVLFASDLPKTRTLKIMRRLVRSVLLREGTGDLSGLVNPESLDELQVLASQQQTAAID